MLIVKNRGYKRNYSYSGSGIFQAISDFLRRLLVSTVAKQVALDAAVSVGKKLADRTVNKLIKQPDDLRRKASDVIDNYLSITGSGNAIAI